MIKGIVILTLVHAIYISEGGAHTRHPYGILGNYHNPKQVCINTIKHRLRLWNGKGSFIAYLGKTYCPVGAFNDRNYNVNKNWVKNTTFYYNEGL